MNIVSAGAIHYLTGIDVKYSPCGRELGFLGQIACLGKHYPRAELISLAAFSCFNVLFILSTAYVSLPLMFKNLTVNPLTSVTDELIRLINEFSVIVLLQLPMYTALMIYIIWLDEIVLQREEKELVRALGGQRAFHHLPLIEDIENEKELRKLESSDVYHQPISKGFLADGRLFLALQVQEKPPHQQLPAVTILCQKKWSILGDKWKVLGHQKIALGRKAFWVSRRNLEELIAGRHLTHELV